MTFSVSFVKKLITALVLTALMAAAAVIFIPWIKTLYDPALRDRFVAYAHGLGAWGYVMMLMLQVLQVIVAVIPGEPVEIMAGAVCGGLGGLALCLIGSAVATTAVFAIMRRLGQPLLRRLFPSRRLEEFSFIRDSRKLETVTFLLFLIPGTPKDMLTYVAGTTPIPMHRFILISTFARIPSVVSSTFIGDTVLSGNWHVTAVILIATMVLGLVGIFTREKVMRFCRSHSHRARAGHRS